MFSSVVERGFPLFGLLADIGKSPSFGADIDIAFRVETKAFRPESFRNASAAKEGLPSGVCLIERPDKIDVPLMGSNDRLSRREAGIDDELGRVKTGGLFDLIHGGGEKGLVGGGLGDRD